MNTQLHFKLTPGDGLQQYLGAWAHMLIASDDLIDVIHLHPFIADGGPEIQFNATLPRPGHDLSRGFNTSAMDMREYRTLRRHARFHSR